MWKLKTVPRQAVAQRIYFTLNLSNAGGSFAHLRADSTLNSARKLNEAVLCTDRSLLIARDGDDKGILLGLLTL